MKLYLPGGSMNENSPLLDSLDAHSILLGSSKI